ncbi:hypothetical protein [Methanogenium cariaci]|jgi:hypothetical protein
MGYQTTIQDEDAIRLGSVKFEVAAYSDTPSYTDLGAMKNTKLVESIEFASIEPDNAPPIKRVNKQAVVITGDWQEPTLSGLNLLRGGIDTYSAVAGTDTFSTGGKSDVGYIKVQLTNTNAASKTYVVAVKKAQITKGLEQAFGADGELTTAAVPLEITGEVDLTEDAGEQLFSITDMQAPTTPAA